MKTPLLLELHKTAGARLGEYAGWTLPIDYGSTLKEALAVRTASGLFDVSHMGRLDIVGPQAGSVLQTLLTNDITLLSDGAGQYTLMCNPAGGVKEDLIVYRRAADSYLLVVNAANVDKDKSWIGQHLTDSTRLIDCTETTAMFALQGPQAVAVLAQFGFPNPERIPRFHFLDTDVHGTRILAARTGYTGEDGFELICASADAEKVWTGILRTDHDLGCLPCGLAVRDVLRIEAGLPLYGHEITENTTPAEAGLMRFVRLTKGEFVGRAAIAGAAAEGTAFRLVGIEMDGRFVPREGDGVLTTHGSGRVTSGTYSPTLSKGIAMAYVPRSAGDGERAVVDIHGTERVGIIRRLPSYARKH